MRYAAAGAAACAVAALLWLGRPDAPTPTVPPPRPAAAPPPRPRSAGMTARSLLPDAERAGQVAGQLGELRFRLARAATPDAPGCRSDRLEGAADAFAAARSAPDDADWPALGAALDAALADVDRCDAPGVPAVVARLRGWRDLPPFQP